jgi:hypothetical protein
LCNLVAQGAHITERTVSARSGKRTNRDGFRTVRTDLLQNLQESDSGVEQAIETASLMLGIDKSLGYCLEMMCADFLAGANLDHGEPRQLLRSALHFFNFLPPEQQREFTDLVKKRPA